MSTLSTTTQSLSAYTNTNTNTMSTLSALTEYTSSTITTTKKEYKTNSTEHIVQIGCGVVGGAYARAFHDYGFHLTCIDVMSNIIKGLKDDGLVAYHKNELPSNLNADIILISVPTPLDVSEETFANEKVDKLVEAGSLTMEQAKTVKRENRKLRRLSMKYVWSTIDTCVDLIEKSSGKTPIIVLRSTVHAGVTEEFRKQIASKTDKKFFLGFQPEFLRAVSALEDAKHPWKIIFGTETEEGEDYQRLFDMYSSFVQGDRSKVKWMQICEAEMMKVVHNYFNAFKISFANGMMGALHHINPNIDAQNVMNTIVETCEGLMNPKYGLRVGSAYGGVCLPKDAPEMIYYCPPGPIKDFFAGAEEVNDWMKEHPELQREMKESPNWVSFEELMGNKTTSKKNYEPRKQHDIEVQKQEQEIVKTV